MKSISQLHQQCLAGRDAVCNWLFSGALDLTYVVESAEWAVAEDGRGICKGLVNHKLMKARVSRSSRFVRSRICHFGSEHVAWGWLRRREHQRAQANVLTWFHVVPDYSRNAEIAAQRERFVRVHTSCQNTKNELVAMGFEEKRIRVIPTGVDRRILNYRSRERHDELRRRLGISDDVIVVGSFQKDGVGWGEGLEPKLVKGPDVFADVVEELAKKCRIHVLLVGPARGYVKHRLQAAGVPFTYLGYFKRYSDVWPWFSTLDLYIIASRIEGGPRSILEAWATGVPVVSTRVGWVPDIATDGENALLADVEDRSTLVRCAMEVIENPDLRRKLIDAGRREVCKYTFDVTAQRYYRELYKELL